MSPNAPSIAVIIPAFNEEGTVAEVVRAAQLLTPTVVVTSDGSSDHTAQVAREAGANVVEFTENQGKGPALKAALEATDAQYVVMLDADLVGLTRQHLDILLGPVLRGELEMTIGVFEGGKFTSDFGNKMTPHLSGQRACQRQLLLDVPGLGDERWPEPAITRYLKEQHVRWGYVDLPAVSQVLKEKKRGFWKGVGHRTKMYADIISYPVRRLKK